MGANSFNNLEVVSYVVHYLMQRVNDHVRRPRHRWNCLSNGGSLSALVCGARGRKLSIGRLSNFGSVSPTTSITLGNTLECSGFLIKIKKWSLIAEIGCRHLCLHCDCQQFGHSRKWISFNKMCRPIHTLLKKTHFLNLRYYYRHRLTTAEGRGSNGDVVAGSINNIGGISNHE
jgi:hypothetical protein